jgi:hypothetical protein
MSNHERETSRAPAGDTALDRAWHQVSDEQPPPALDAAIIAAARQPTQGGNERAQVNRVSPPQRTWLARWQPLAAAAAVAGLAFVLVHTLPRDHDVAPSMRTEEPALGPATTQKEFRRPPAGEANAGKAAQPSESAVAPEPSATAGRALTQTAIPAPMQATPSAAVPPSSNSVTATDTDAATRATATSAAELDRQPEATSKASDGIASAEVAAPARERRQNDQIPPSAADRAARIAALHASGDITGAEAALREFRAANPDADTYLPESLRNWARTVE